MDEKLLFYSTFMLIGVVAIVSIVGIISAQTNTPSFILRPTPSADMTNNGGANVAGEGFWYYATSTINITNRTSPPPRKPNYVIRPRPVPVINRINMFLNNGYHSFSEGRTYSVWSPSNITNVTVTSIIPKGHYGEVYFNGRRYIMYQGGKYSVITPYNTTNITVDII